MIRVGFWRSPITGLAAFFASGLAALLYDLLFVSGYKCDGEASAPFIRYLVPIVARSYHFVAGATGDLCRAALARHLYAVDWIVCLIGLGLALPSLRQILHATTNAVSGKLEITVKPTAQRGLDIWLFIIVVGALLSLEEAWYGEFSTQSSFYTNNVATNDADLYRLCLFTPLALLFTSLSVIFLYAKYLYRPG